MKNKRALFKLFLVTATVLAIFGLTSCGKSFINEHAIAEKFDHIQITTDTADVNVIPTDGECRVVCNETNKLTHGVTVENGVLKIQVTDTRSGLEKLFTPETSVTVYLPTADYTTLAIEVDTGDVSVSGITCTSSISAKIDTGDVELENVKASEIAVGTDTGEIDCESVRCTIFAAKTESGDISLVNVIAEGKFDILSSTGDVRFTACDAVSVFVTTDTGDVELENVKAGEIAVGTDTGEIDCESVRCTIFAAKTETGNISLEDVIADGKFDIVSETGDVEFEDCDAASVFIKTEVGDIKGSFLSDKIIFAETDTGKKDYPHLTSGGKCEVSTNTGNIKISIKK